MMFSKKEGDDALAEAAAQGDEEPGHVACHYDRVHEACVVAISHLMGELGALQCRGCATYVLAMLTQRAFAAMYAADPGRKAGHSQIAFDMLLDMAEWVHDRDAVRELIGTNLPGYKEAMAHAAGGVH
jgi:hypothetical protein